MGDETKPYLVTYKRKKNSKTKTKCFPEKKAKRKVFGGAQCDPEAVFFSGCSEPSPDCEGETNKGKPKSYSITYTTTRTKKNGDVKTKTKTKCVSKGQSRRIAKRSKVVEYKC